MNIEIREVWACNLLAEFSIIQRILPRFNVAAIDTEFPGTIYPIHAHHHAMSTLDYYQNMKQNVDELNLIQFGLTLSDRSGNLPDLFGTGVRSVWQFNFRDFDPDHDPNNPESISLLQQQGINFSKNKMFGIDSRVFGNLFRHMLLSMKMFRVGGRVLNITWVTFHGSSDFGFFIKILTDQRELPERLEDFMCLVHMFLGDRILDLKPIVRVIGLFGGLDRIAKDLGLRRPGKSHQAGSDSLLTMQIVMELERRYEREEENRLNTSLLDDGCDEFSYKLYGLA